MNDYRITDRQTAHLNGTLGTFFKLFQHERRPVASFSPGDISRLVRLPPMPSAWPRRWRR